jgi:NADPH:quinone reductase-like Zn-dependent oxidoreductase
MNAAVVTAFDAPPTYSTFAEPIPAEGERLVNVTAAGLHRIVRALANGSHYGSTGELPFIPGVDGAGRLEDGTRVYFGIARPPFGTFAEKTLATTKMIIPLPDGLDDATAAAAANPGMSSWVALNRGSFTVGESVLILGATGTSGQLAVQIARHRGAKRVVAAGRNPEALKNLITLGADAVISLEQPPEALTAAFREEFSAGIDIVLDYLWGPPAEAVFSALTQKGLSHAASRVRYVQIGNTAAANITLPAAILRSSGLELLGSGFGSASLDQIRTAVADFFTLMATKPLAFKLKTANLSDIESVWNTPDEGARIVFQP